MSTVLKAHICAICIYYSPLSRKVQCTLFIRELYIAAELSKRIDEWIVTFLVLAMVVVVVVLNGNMKAMVMTLGGTGMKKLHSFHKKLVLAWLIIGWKILYLFLGSQGRLFNFFLPSSPMGSASARLGMYVGKKQVRYFSVKEATIATGTGHGLLFYLGSWLEGRLGGVSIWPVCKLGSLATCSALVWPPFEWAAFHRGTPPPVLL